MASLFSETYEGAASGTAITTANSQWDNVVGTGSMTYSTAQVLADGGGTRSGRYAATAQIANHVGFFTASSVGFLRAYLYVETMPSANTAIFQFTSTATVRAEMQLGASGVIRIRNSSLTAIATAPSGTIPTGAWCRIEWSYSNTAGTQRLKVYKGAQLHGSTPDYDSGSVSSTAAGTFDRLAAGVIASGTETIYLDNVAVDDAAFPAPTGNQPPIANAGPDQTVEPWATVALSGSDSDADGTVASRVWAQATGTTASDLGATLVADTWDTSIGAAWEILLGAPAVVSGRLRLADPSAFDVLRSVTTYDTTSAWASTEVPARTSTRTETEANFGYRTTDMLSRVVWTLTGTSLVARYFVGGVATNVVTLTYDAAAHRYWRLRESGGSYFWDTSPDGATWTQRGTWAYTWATSVSQALRVFFSNGNNSSLAASGYIEFDNVRLATRRAAAPTFTAPASIAGETLTFTYTVTDNGGVAIADTVAVTVLPVTERAAIGGVEVPMRVLEV